MDFFNSCVGRLLSSENSGGLCRELTATKEQAERIYSVHSCVFPVKELTKLAMGREEHCNSSQKLGEHK